MQPITRRGFLEWLGIGAGAIALEAAIPLNRVWSFPKKIVIAHPANIRFLRAYDPTNAAYICRFDALYGFDSEIPNAVEACEQIRIYRDDQLQPAIDALAAKYNVESIPEGLLHPRFDKSQAQQCWATARSIDIIKTEPRHGWVFDPYSANISQFRVTGYRKADAPSIGGFVSRA